ncbi:MAG: hypothetical protein DHS20C16_10970 [Phycisphaerae bacterium]|nr:MAG: hypothetical protein DHS20C16_10970 [Phycisphaerae bacterium]
MLAELNRIKNADFSQGQRKPRGWKWTSAGEAVDWRPMPKSSNGHLSGMELECTDTQSGGFWSQKFRCKKDQFYRVEVVVSCDCASDDGYGGLNVQMLPFDRERKPLKPFAFEPLQQAHEYTLRGFFKADHGIASVEMQIGMRHAEGMARIHDVRVIPVIEPESRSHPAALPPLPFAHQPPKPARSVSVISKQTDRPIVDLLSVRLGKNRVVAHGSTKLQPKALQADAVLILDDKPLAKVGSVKALDALAKDRVVIVSTRYMEAISDGHLLTKLVKQIDDPFHARVVHSNFVTSGFALYDQIPFAGRGDHSSQMYQRQFRQNKVFKDFCKKHGLEVLLDSVTDSETSSEKPIALYKRTTGGAIVVIDVDPIEAVGSSLHEAVPAVNLILSALGVRQQSVGQFIAVSRTQEEYHSHLCDMVDRYPALAWPEERRPADSEQPAIITVGRDRETVGLPVVERPAIIVRSILNGGDLDAAYGMLLWIKSMLRPAPFVSPYANTLNRHFRIAWLPHGTHVGRWGGWSADEGAERHDIDAEFDKGALAAWIDVTTAPAHEVRVSIINSKAIAKRLAPLPTLMEQLMAKRHFYRSPGPSADRSRIDDITWRVDDLRTYVVTDDHDFTDPIHRSAASAGAALIRIELPASHSAPLGDSIWKTDWTAMLMEQIFGLMMGMLVVNRDAAPMTFDWPKSLSHLRENAVMRKINKPDVDLPLPKSAGNKVKIPSASAIIASG